MPQLDLRLLVNLERYDPSDYPRKHGPIFYEFLPNGRKDAILLSRKEDSVRVWVWFEQMGFMRDDGLIIFDRTKREIDQSAIPLQGKLDGGPLWGRLEADVTDNELAAVRAGVADDATYIALGKRMLRAAVPPIRAFIDALRFTFGQYWLEELSPWDSRTHNLGGYCSSLQLQWSHDGGTTWERFLPTPPLVILPTTVVILDDLRYRSYLGAEDWQALAQMDWPYLAAADRKPQIVDEVLSAAHQLVDRGNYRHALIEAVVALELVIKTVTRRRKKEREELALVLERLAGQGTAVQLMALPMIAPSASFDRSDLENAVTAIERRNKAMHEGWQPKASDAALIWSVLRVVGAALGPPSRRFPESTGGNRLRPRETPPGVSG